MRYQPILVEFCSVKLPGMLFTTLDLQADGNYLRLYIHMDRE